MPKKPTNPYGLGRAVKLFGDERVYYVSSVPINPEYQYGLGKSAGETIFFAYQWEFIGLPSIKERKR